MNGVSSTWTRETYESSKAQLQQAQEQVKLLTDSQHAVEQPAQLEAELTLQAAEQPVKRVPWWKRLFADI
jgi:hypothetical protein